MGRVEHQPIGRGELLQASPERVQWAKTRYPLVYAELNPGDIMFFHSNLLHRSDKNSSDKRRWAFLVAYNRADNNPIYKHHHPQYTKLNKVTNIRPTIIDNSTRNHTNILLA